MPTATDIPLYPTVRHAVCQTCQGPMLFARTEAGKAMPLHPYVVPDGNVAVRRDHLGALHCRVVSADQPLAGGEKMAVHHRVLCPGLPEAQLELLGGNVVSLTEKRRQKNQTPPTLLH